MSFRVDLDIFRGPLDLLLFLVRKHELEIVDIPISGVTEQYLTYLDILEQLDINAVGDFVEIASTLIEIKSRTVLPRVEETSEPLDDPREELVQRLLEYKKYKDAACILDEKSRQWQQSYARLSVDLPPRTIDMTDHPIHEVELWDLVSAFGRIMRAAELSKPSSIVYDETPIHVHMQTIHHRLSVQDRLAFSDTFQVGVHKSRMIGMFLALLELMRHHGVGAEQAEPHGEIWLFPLEAFERDVQFSEVRDYNHKTSEPVERSTSPEKPE